MAKDKKVEIIDEELTPTVLKTIKEKKSNVIWLIIIFAIFIAVVVFLPDIAKYVEDYMNGNDTTPVVPNNSTQDDTEIDEEEEEEISEYQLVDGLQIDFDDFSLTNFVVANNQISFSITNKGTNLLNFSQLDYFLNLYNSNNMLVQRIMITDVLVSANNTVSVSYEIVEPNIVSLSFIEISEEEYPAHVLTTDEAGNATLTCTNGYETVNYLLTNNQVYAIEDIFNVPITDANYGTLYSSYQALATTYNTINGITSRVTLENNGLNFRTDIDLNTVDENNFNSIVYYPLNTDARVMNFELEANGYNCN